MKIYKAYKTELDLNNSQRTHCLQHSGCARFTYNWALSQKIQARESGQRVPSIHELGRKLNALKKTDFPWMYQVSKCAPQDALTTLERAFENFFRRYNNKKKEGYEGKLGFPKFKSKRSGIGGFHLMGSIKVYHDSIQLPRIGKVRLKESFYLPIQGVKILNVSITEHIGRWFASLNVEEEIADPIPDESKPVVGVDLGIKTLATLSDGTTFENPKVLRTNLKKLKKLQRIVSRRQKGSANRKKAVRRLARLHYKVANIRKDTLHKMTTQLTKTKSVVVIEDLNVSGMLRNHKLAQAISDVGFGEFRRQLEYKAAWYGCTLLVADRFFPSSKMCNECSVLNESLTLADRTWTCCCGVVHDRDLNAAINLRKLSVSSTAAMPVDEKALAASKDVVKLTRMKQEPNLDPRIL